MSLSTQQILAIKCSMIISNYTLYWALNGDCDLQFVVKQNDTGAMWTACVDTPFVFTTKQFEVEIGMDTMCDMLVGHFNGAKDEITDITFHTPNHDPTMAIHVQFKLGIVHQGNQVIALKRHEEPSVKEPSALAVNKDDMLQITVTQSGKTWRAAISCDKIEKVVDNGVSVSNELVLFKKEVGERMDRLESILNKVCIGSNDKSNILKLMVVEFMRAELIPGPYGSTSMNMFEFTNLFNIWTTKKCSIIHPTYPWDTLISVLRENCFRVSCGMLHECSNNCSKDSTVHVVAGLKVK